MPIFSPGTDKLDMTDLLIIYHKRYGQIESYDFRIDDGPWSGQIDMTTLENVQAYVMNAVMLSGPDFERTLTGKLLELRVSTENDGTHNFDIDLSGAAEMFNKFDEVCPHR